MTIPVETTVPGEGKGTTLWILNAASDREDAVATPSNDSLFDRIGHIVDFQGPSMSKDVTTDAYIDSEDGFLEKSGGDIDPGQIKFTVAYKPGDPVQRRMYEKAWRESKDGATVVCLIPARTDTKWWSVS